MRALLLLLCLWVLLVSGQAQCSPPFGKKAVTKVVSGSGSSWQGVPTDLAFHPQKEGELWVSSAGRSDGRMNGNFIIKGAGTSEQHTQLLRDRIPFHYQDNVMAMAFDQKGEKLFTCQESINPYLGLSAGPTYFMGPTAYEVAPCNNGYGRKQADGSCRDLTVNGRGDEGCNGADQCFVIHSDMLHEAPLCNGIAHDAKAKTGTTGLNYIKERVEGNTVWYLDGVREKLMRFDFDKLHDPLLIDHRFANIRRYVDINVKRVPGVPGHMVMNTDARILYVNDAGNKRVLRVDADSGRFLRDAKCINELCYPEHNKRYRCYPKWGATVLHNTSDLCKANCDGECFWNYYEMGCVAGHCTMNECAGDDGLGCYTVFTEVGYMFEYELWGCTSWDVFASDAGTPSGIALGPDGRLYVGDYESGNITAFDPAGNRIGSFHTGAKGLGGLELECKGGQECRMWFTNVLRKEVAYIDVQEPCPANLVPTLKDSTIPLTSKAGEPTCGLVPNYQRPDLLARHGPNFNERMMVNHSYGKHCDGLMPGQNPDGMTDARAQMCPDRTDCSNLNFDLLVMAGFFCHPCLISLCLNGADCTNIMRKGFTCKCPVGYHGDLCELKLKNNDLLRSGQVAGISIGTFVFGLLVGGVVMLVVGKASNRSRARTTSQLTPGYAVQEEKNLHFEHSTDKAISNDVPISHMDPGTAKK